MEEIILTNGSASSNCPQTWSAIDWPRVERSVRATQIRLTKATQAKDWRRVKALQRSLARSFSARAVSVRRVTENQGKRTAGVDHVLWDTPESKMAAVVTLKSRRGYKPLPLKRVYIPKSDGKRRALGIPSMFDRACQALHQLGLDPIVEATSDPNSYGFRRGRATADAMSQLFGCLARGISADWILEADIKGCFDHIDHDWLLANVRMDRGVLRKWLKSGVLEDRQLLATNEGTPQGGVISPTLANVALNGLESELLAHLRRKFGVNKMKALKVNVIRYADDFVVTGSSQEILVHEIRPWIESFLAVRGLTLSDSKTRVTHIDTGFDFLGWNFRKYRRGRTGRVLLIKPSKKNVQAFYTKVSALIKSSINASAGYLIGQLNPILQGWSRYHSGIVAKQVFSKLDSLIFWRLTRWARRKHPSKPLGWVRQLYWQSNGVRKDFADNTATHDGERRRVLYRLADTAIRRHQKVQAAYNPYDPTWELYGEELRSKRMAHALSHRLVILKLYKSQNGKCALCGDAITQETGWHDHHVVYKMHGGTDALSNRVLVHPVCHRQIHSLGLKVMKPASP